MRHQKQPAKRVRVRSKSLAEIDETKLSLALWLMAKRIVEEEAERDPLDNEPTRRKAA
jgi:hypothetical protein